MIKTNKQMKQKAKETHTHVEICTHIHTNSIKIQNQKP